MKVRVFNLNRRLVTMQNKDYIATIESAIAELAEISVYLTKAKDDIAFVRCPPIFGDPPKGVDCLRGFNYKTLDEAMLAFSEWIIGAGSKMAPPK